MVYVSVKGGTRAGWRTVHEPGQAWDCGFCGEHNARYLTRCRGCGTSRD